MSTLQFKKHSKQLSAANGFAQRCADDGRQAHLDAVDRAGRRAESCSQVAVGTNTGRISRRFIFQARAMAHGQRIRQAVRQISQHSLLRAHVRYAARAGSYGLLRARPKGLSPLRQQSAKKQAAVDGAHSNPRSSHGALRECSRCRWPAGRRRSGRSAWRVPRA